MNPSEEKCAYCGEQATQFLFAQSICDKVECVDRARDDRGGPGGHIFEKARHAGPTIETMDFDEEMD